MIYTPFIWPLILAAVLMAGIALYVRRYRDIPAAVPSTWLMWICTLWSSIYALAICTTDLALRVFFGNTIIFLAQCCSYILLVLALEYIGKGHWLNRRRVFLIVLIPVFITALAFTSGFHHLFRYNFRIDVSGGLSALIFDRGPFYLLYILSLLIPNVAASVLLLRSTHLHTKHFWNTLLIVVGYTIPLVAGILYAVGITPIHGYDYSSTTIVITAAFIIPAIVRGRWLDVVKIARDSVLDNITDLVVVVNNRNVIVDFNLAAKKTFDFPSKPMTGINPDSLPAHVSTIFKCCKENPAQNKEFYFSTHIYDLTITPIVDRRQQRLGRLYLFHDITDRKNIERVLRENEEKFRVLSNATASGMFVYLEDRFVLVNPAFQQITGFDEEELLKMNIADIVHPAVSQMVRERQLSRLRGEPVPERYEINIITKEGEERWVDLSATLITFSGQSASLGTIVDITERKVLEEELRISQALYSNIVEDQTDPVCRWLPDTTLTFVNKAYCAYFGRTREEFLGRRFISWLPLETQMIIQSAIDSLYHGEADFVTREEYNYDLHGNMRWMAWAYYAIRDAEGKIIEFQSVGRDITDRLQAEEALNQVNAELAMQLDEIQSLQEELREQAMRDILTGLFNRRYMEETLDREISSAMRSQHKIGLLMMDLDFFKILNDTYGHKAGDNVLRTIGKLLLSHTRHMDVACRYGGEEFVIILPTASLEDATKRAESLRQAVAAMRVPFLDHILYTTISIGVAGFPFHGDNSDVLLRAADDALYAAKAAGRNCVVVKPMA